MRMGEKRSCLEGCSRPSAVIPLSGDYSGMILVEASAHRVLSMERPRKKKRYSRPSVVVPLSGDYSRMILVEASARRVLSMERPRKKKVERRKLPPWSLLDLLGRW